MEYSDSEDDTANDSDTLVSKMTMKSFYLLLTMVSLTATFLTIFNEASVILTRRVMMMTMSTYDLTLFV